MHELIHNDRVVGGTSKQATVAAKNLYTRFVKGAIIETDARTAETSKLLENTYRDINIALANELAELASSVGVDVDRAFALANRHPRVHLHRPGIGVGGHCIPVDPWFLVAINPHRAQLLSAARAVNDGVPSRVAAAIITELRRCYRASVVLLGLSYKEDVDDFRGSSSVEVAHRLALEPWLRVIVVDPHCSKLPQHLEQLGTVELMEEDEATATDSLIVLLTRHKLFGPLVAKRPDVVDARELLYGTNEALPAALTGPQEVTGRDLKAGPDDSEAPRLY